MPTTRVRERYIVRRDEGRETARERMREGMREADEGGREGGYAAREGREREWWEVTDARGATMSEKRVAEEQKFRRVAPRRKNISVFLGASLCLSLSLWTSTSVYYYSTTGISGVFSRSPLLLLLIVPLAASPPLFARALFLYTPRAEERVNGGRRERRENDGNANL